MLHGRYLEKPVAAGLEAGGRLFEVFAAKDGATWTMVVTTPERDGTGIASNALGKSISTFMPSQ